MTHCITFGVRTKLALQTLRFLSSLRVLLSFDYAFLLNTWNILRNSPSKMFINWVQDPCYIAFVIWRFHVTCVYNHVGAVFELRLTVLGRVWPCSTVLGPCPVLRRVHVTTPLLGNRRSSCSSGALGFISLKLYFGLTGPQYGIGFFFWGNCWQRRSDLPYCRVVPRRSQVHNLLNKGRQGLEHLPLKTSWPPNSWCSSYLGLAFSTSSSSYILQLCSRLWT